MRQERRAIEPKSSRSPASFDVPESPEFEIPAPLGIQLPAGPNLSFTEGLRRCNELAELPGTRETADRAAGWKGRFAEFIRRRVAWVVEPTVAQQREFNAQAVRHLNRIGAVLEERVRSIEVAIEGWSANPGGITERLEQALQTYEQSLARRQMVQISALEEEIFSARSLARDALQHTDDLGAELRRERDAIMADRDRYRDQVIGTLQEELSNTAGDLQVAHQAINEEQRASAVSIRTRLDDVSAESRRQNADLRAVERGLADLRGLRAFLQESSAALAPTGGADDVASPSASAVEITSRLRDDDYRAFQAEFRGDETTISDRQRAHVELFVPAAGVVVDLGCGRGEFLELLRDAGHEAIGIDTNQADIDECKRRGLNAVRADLLEWLSDQPRDVLGGIFLAQVIEHMEPRYWKEFIDLAYSRMKPDGSLVVETINPLSLYAYVRAYLADPTHVRPVPASVLEHLAKHVGFDPVQIRFQAPVPEQERPMALPVESFAADPKIRQALALVEERFRRIDRILCAPQEYVLYAQRP